MNRLLGFLLMYSCLCFSCGERTNIEFELNRDKYEKIIECAHEKYLQFFLLSTSNTSASIYNAGRNKNLYCLDIINEIKSDKIEIISINRDSSVTIYFKAIFGFKTKQIGLLHTNSNNKIYSEYNGEFRIIEIKGEGWYVFERTISLAD